MSAWWRQSRPRAFARLAGVGLHLAWGVLQIALAFPFLAASGRDRLKRHWSRGLLAWLDIRLEHDADTAAIDQGLLVCNHVSFIDIFVINSLLPSAFVAKSDVAGWPLIGWLCRCGDTLFIERGSRQAVRQLREQIGERLLAGTRLAIFPEGTTTAGDRVLPFHAALLQSAIDTGVPVHALSIRYTDPAGQRSEAPAYYNQIGMIDCMLSTLRAGGIGASLRIAARFDPPHSDRRHLAHHAHQAVVTALAAQNRSSRLPL